MQEVRILQVFHIVPQRYPAVERLENFIQCLVLKKLPVNIQAETLALVSGFHQQTDVPLDRAEQLDPIQVHQTCQLNLYRHLTLGLCRHLEGYNLHGDRFRRQFSCFRSFMQCTPQITVCL